MDPSFVNDRAAFPNAPGSVSYHPMKGKLCLTKHPNNLFMVKAWPLDQSFKHLVIPLRVIYASNFAYVSHVKQVESMVKPSWRLPSKHSLPCNSNQRPNMTNCIHRPLIIMRLLWSSLPEPHQPPVHTQPISQPRNTDCCSSICTALRPKQRLASNYRVCIILVVSCCTL
jgi:hypothetical protein